MKIHLKHVSASENGDYYQVLFENEPDGEGPYVLVQRQFEGPDGGRCYVETHDQDYIGHFRVVRADLRRNRLFLQLQRRKAPIIDVTFNTSAANFIEVNRVLRIMIPHLKVVDAKYAC